MKKIKFLLIVFLFFLTGCSASYELVIDKTITENINLNEDRKLIETYTTPDKFIEDEMSIINKDGNYFYYKKNTEVTDTDIIGNGKKTYNSFEKFKKNSIIINTMFKNIDYVKKIKTTRIVMEANEEFNYFDESTFCSAFIDNLDIKIKVPGEVISGNYDKVENGYYIWKCDKNSKIKDIELEYTNQTYNYIFLCLAIILVIGIYLLMTYIKYKHDRKY